MADTFKSRWSLAPLVIDHIAAALRVSQQEACVELQQKMLDGSVLGRGPLGSASAVAIKSEFWRFALPDVDGHAVNLSTMQRLSWFEVCAADVLMIWAAPPRLELKPFLPNKATKIASIRGRGAPNDVTMRVVEAMRTWAAKGNDLAKAKQIELEVEFKASRATCDKARRVVLSENVTNSILTIRDH